MRRDKKRNEERYTFILSPEFGRAEIARVGEKQIEGALNRVRKDGN
jgi:3-dehydroquinate synthetase